MQGVVVLLPEAVRGVRHQPRVVPNDKAFVLEQATPLGRLREQPARDRALMRLKDLLRERLVGAFGQAALLVEESEHADGGRLGREHFDALLIVGLRDGVPSNRLAQIDLLLLAEDLRVEVRLQLLVGEVDAELLERVDLELLEAKNVEDANEGARLRVGEQANVDLLAQPVEETRIDRLGQRVAGVSRLLHLERDLVDRIRHGAHRARHESLFEALDRGLHEVGCRLQRGRLHHLARVVIRVHKIDIAEVENHCEQTTNALLLLWEDPNRSHRHGHLFGIRRVVDGRHVNHAILEVCKVVGSAQPQLLLLTSRGRREQLVEGVVVALLARLRHCSGLL
mmetsp:Transcript_6645/g.16124  ORF Transcript_6645/g.16124 Transcript_6645/m.16124 type:complete len:339 (-) Transcript_6645:610-1626(-)